VRRVELGIAVHEVFIAESAPFPAGCDAAAEFVLISALGVNHFAENAVFYHPEQGHFFPSVAAVFEEHAVIAGALICSDDLPAFVYRSRPAALDGGVFAGFHRGGGKIAVRLPGRRNDNAVDVAALKHPAVSRYSRRL
jgi:hypothetical protein